MLRRLTFYDLAGKFVSSSNNLINVDARFPASRTLALLADGSLLVEPQIGARVTVSAPDTRIATVRTDMKGTVLDTVAVAPVGAVTFAIETKGVTYGSHPFPHSPGVAASSDGKQVVAYSFIDPPSAKVARVAITFYNVATHRTTRLTAAFPAVEVTNKMKQVVVERLATAFARAGGSPQDWKPTIEKAIPWPEHLAPVTRVVLGANGYAAFRREDDGSSDITWLITQLPGRAIGTFVVPRGDRFLGIEPGHLWIARHDDDGIAALVRYSFQQ